MRKLAYIITRTEPGGAQRHVYELIDYFRYDYHVFLICGEKDWLFHEASSKGIEVIHIKELVRQVSPFKDFLAIRHIRKVLEKNNIDLVHTHSTKGGFIGRMAASQCKIPAVFTAHGWGFHPDAGIIRSNYVWLIEKFLAFRTAKIICVSEFDRELAMAKHVGNKQKLITIHNGIRDSPHRKDFKIVGAPKKIVMVARFAPPKDQLTLIKAFEKIKRTDCELHFFGDGPGLSEVRQLVLESAVCDRIKFHGLEEDVESRLAAYEIFVLSSLHEGLPISIIEALRTGLPVVASNVGGVSELLEFCPANLIENSDICGLSQRLEELLDNKELRTNLGKQGRDYYLDHFGLLKMCLKVEAVYADL